MECNVGGSDRALRTGLGSGFVLSALAGPATGVTRAGLLGVGVIALATAGSRYCPLNAAIGLNTCRQDGD